jgi:hypothetical protein
MTNVIALWPTGVDRRRSRDHLPRQIGCSACGATANASCDCGAPYLPAGQRAAEAVAANPEKSDRAIAAEIGVDKNTVAAARRKSGGEDSPPEKRTGKDGKSYPVKVAKPAPVDDDRESTPESLQGIYLVRADLAIQFATYTNQDLAKLAKTTCNGDSEKIIAAARQVAAKWTALADQMERKATRAPVRRKLTPAQKRRANFKISRAYSRQFGGFTTELNPDVVRRMEASMQSGVDEFAGTKREQLEHHERREREQEEFLAQPITTETEDHYTTLIKQRQLYEGACELSWEQYFKYRDEHPDLPPLSPDDLEYAGMWTSCAARPLM